MNRGWLYLVIIGLGTLAGAVVWDIYQSATGERSNIDITVNGYKSNVLVDPSVEKLISTDQDYLNFLAANTAQAPLPDTALPIVIPTVQLNQRDTERRDSLSNINKEVIAWYGDYGSYPTSITITNGGKTVSLSSTLIPTATPRAVTLKGNAVARTDGGATTQQNTGTAYCYLVNPTATSYSLGVNFEGNGWGAANSSSQLSSDSSLGLCTNNNLAIK